MPSGLRRQVRHRGGDRGGPQRLGDSQAPRGEPVDGDEGGEGQPPRAPEPGEGGQAGPQVRQLRRVPALQGRVRELLPGGQARRVQAVRAGVLPRPVPGLRPARLRAARPLAVPVPVRQGEARAVRPAEVPLRRPEGPGELRWAPGAQQDRHIHLRGGARLHARRRRAPDQERPVARGGMAGPRGTGCPSA